MATRSTDGFENDFHDLAEHGLDIGYTGTRRGVRGRGREERTREGHDGEKRGTRR